MTFFEKWKKEHPGSDWAIYDDYPVGSCPSDFGYEEHHGCVGVHCRECWAREIPEEKTEKPVTDACFDEDGYSPKLEPTIKDSGDRTQFETGAVRDMREGKGRCDLMPLDVVAAYIEDDPDKTDFVLWHIKLFQEKGLRHYLFGALHEFAAKRGWDSYTMFLEAAIHFEEGAKKYGENNWQKGIPVYCYIDSAVRHYLKWLRVDTDEPHDRAFVWNILCAMWTCEHMPKMNTYSKENT